MGGGRLVTSLLCIDPGSERNACVALELRGNRALYLRGGIYELGDPAFAYEGRHLILELLDERLYAFNQGRVKEMVRTARMEGQLLALARAAGIEPMTCSAGEARGELCRAANASDAQVALVVEALVEGAPRDMRKADRQHVYDACLYGLVGLTRLGARFKLPPEAERALHVLRAQERAKAAAKGKATKAARALPSAMLAKARAR